MKSVVDETPTKKAPEYPCLMKSSLDGTVVLFSSEERGTVVDQAGGTDQVGHYCCYWDGTSFSPLYGTVTLSND